MKLPSAGIAEVQGVQKMLCPACVAGVEEQYILSSSLSWFLLSCIGQASTSSLRPCISHSDKWLLIYGREKAK